MNGRVFCSLAKFLFSDKLENYFLEFEKKSFNSCNVLHFFISESMLFTDIMKMNFVVIVCSRESLSLLIIPSVLLFDYFCLVQIISS